GAGAVSGYARSYSSPSGYLIRGVEAQGNLYITTSSGVQVIQDLSGTAARFAGAPRSLDPSYVCTGAVGFLEADSQCAYRCLIQRTDLNGNVLFGYPSTRL